MQYSVEYIGYEEQSEGVIALTNLDILAQSPS